MHNTTIIVYHTSRNIANDNFTKKNKKNFKKVLTFKKVCNIITLALLECEKSSGFGPVWLGCLIWDQEVAGSSPVTPTKQCAGVVQW